MTTLTRGIVRLALARNAAGLPRDVDRKARLHIADAIGIALAARRESSFGQRPPFGEAATGCSILGSDRRADLPGAAFVNSALVHVLDFDDIHDAARLHPTTVTLPAALAAAEAMNAGLDAVRAAVAIGNELICRLGLMWKPSGTGGASHWFLTQLFGYFAAALAAGLALRMDEDELVSALGLASMQAAGAKEAGFGVGSNARAIYPAFAAMGGMQAALLARSGMVGPPAALEGAAGLFPVYLGSQADAGQRAILLDPDEWAFRATEVKPWPCCRLSHPYVAAAFAVRDAVKADPIRRVVVKVNASAAKLCRPLEDRRRPETLQDAKYSIPFVTAFALAHGRVDLATLGPEAVHDAAALDLARRVEIDESLPDGPGHPPAVIVVTTDRGEVTSPVGRPPVPDEAAIRAKFEACLAHAGNGVDGVRIWEAVTGPGEWPVSELMRATRA